MIQLITDNSIIIISGIFVLFTIFLLKVIINYRKTIKDLTIKNIQLNQKINNLKPFSEIIEFLLYIIKFKVDNYININIRTEIAKNDVSILSDATFQKHIEDCIGEVLKMISSDYSTVLCHYFTYEGLLTFIAEKIYLEIFQVYVETNSTFIIKGSSLVTKSIVNAATESNSKIFMEPS